MECKLHPGVEMKQMWKKSDPNHLGESWYSHKEGAGWCNGKPQSTKSFAQANPERDVMIGQVLASINTKVDRIEATLKVLGGMMASIGGSVQPEPKNVPKELLPF